MEESCLAADACVDRVGKLKQTPPNLRAAVVLSNLRKRVVFVHERHLAASCLDGGRVRGRGGRHPAAPRTQCALTQDGYQRASRSVASPHIPLGCINLKDDVNLIVSKKRVVSDDWVNPPSR